MREQDERTALRLPHEQREKIEQLIKQGNYKNLSQVVRAALSEFLAKQGEG